MKCIICYSRLDFTAHYLCRFSHTEFPWASQVLCWYKSKASPLICIFSASPSTFLIISMVCLCAALPCHPPGWGCRFQWKFNVKNRIQMWHFTPTAAPLRGVSAPEHKWLGQHGSGCVFTWTRVWGEPSVCCRAPAEAALPAGSIRSTVPVPVLWLELCD